MKAKMEQAEAQKAMEEMEAVTARLAKAEAAAKGSGKDAAAVKAEIAKEKKEYEMAKETYTKEANDVKAAQKRVDDAKAELAKWEPYSGAPKASPILAALALLATWLA